MILNHQDVAQLMQLAHDAVSALDSIASSLAHLAAAAPEVTP